MKKMIMENSQNSLFFNRIYNPFIQGGGIFAFVVIAMFGLKGLQISNSMDVSPLAFWMIGGMGLLLFALFNSIISLAISTDMNDYWTRSTGVYAVIMILSGSLAWFLSDLTIGEAGSFRWIFMVVTFGYLFFLSLMRFIKKVVFMAQQEDNRWMNRRK
jgi:hypothetical protein